MPVYNGEAFLSEAIESVLGQTLTAWELLAVDDGSADDSPTIIERYAAADSRVQLVRNETNLGVSATLNRGWRQARGEYIAIAHADDVSLPNRLAQQVNLLDDHPSIAAVGGAMIFIDAEGQRISIAGVPTSSRAIRSTLLRHNCLNHPSVMLRRSALEEAGGYRFDLVEDYDLWLRLTDRYDIMNIAEPVVLYRLHPQQISIQMMDELVRRSLAVRAAARARRRQKHDPLAGVDELTPAVLDQVVTDETKASAALEVALLSRATVLADIGHPEEANELVAQASRRLGPRAADAFAAACELRKAEKLRAAGRPLNSATHVVRALRRDPRYASSQLAGWLADRFVSRFPTRWV